MGSSDRVACVHYTPAFGEVQANRAALVELTRAAADQAQVVVLPELATTGFCLTPEQATTWAEAVDGPTVTALGGVAQAAQSVVVVGLALRQDDQLHNAQVVIDASGEVAGVYAKRHLFGADEEWATPGTTPGATIDTRHGRVGLLICHDIVYPRTVLAVASRRPRLLAFSTAWIGTGATIPETWCLAARLLQPAPLVAANRGGAEGSVRFEDPSAILSHTNGGVIGPRQETSTTLFADLA